MRNNDNNQPNIKRIDILDGLRGLAIVLVILYHYLSFQAGWTGVDLFFVLSGYFITDSLVSLLGCPNYFGIFFLKRILRIVPLYFLFLFIFFQVVPALFPTIVTPSWLDLKQTQSVYWFFFANWQFAWHGWPLNHTITHFWSLSCEAQFYVVWALFVYLLFHKKRLFIAINIILIVAAIIFRFKGDLWFSGNNVFNYVLLPSRIDAFAFGTLAFVLQKELHGRNGKIILCTVAVISLLIFLLGVIVLTMYNIKWSFEHQFVNKIGFTINAVFWFSILLLALANNLFIKIMFNNKITIAFGKYSYGMYIFHLPVFILISKVSFFEANGFIVALTSFLITYLLGWLSYILIESKIMKVKYRISDI